MSGTLLGVKAHSGKFNILSASDAARSGFRGARHLSDNNLTERGVLALAQAIGRHGMSRGARWRLPLLLRLVQVCVSPPRLGCSISACTNLAVPVYCRVFYIQIYTVHCSSEYFRYFLVVRSPLSVLPEVPLRGARVQDPALVPPAVTAALRDRL